MPLVLVLLRVGVDAKSLAKRALSELGESVMGLS